MNYYVMFSGHVIDQFTLPDDKSAKNLANSRWEYFDSLEDDTDRVICTKPKTSQSEDDYQTAVVEITDEDRARLSGPPPTRSK